MNDEDLLKIASGINDAVPKANELDNESIEQGIHYGSLRLMCNWEEIRSMLFERRAMSNELKRLERKLEEKRAEKSIPEVDIMPATATRSWTPPHLLPTPSSKNSTSDTSPVKHIYTMDEWESSGEEGEGRRRTRTRIGIRMMTVCI